MSDALNSRKAGFFVQPGGANKKLYFIGCANVDNFVEPKGDTELIQCFDPANDDEWNTVGENKSPPDPTNTSFDTLFFPESNQLDKLKDGFALYNLFRAGGNASVFSSYFRGNIMQKCTQTSIENTAAQRNEETEAEKMFEVNGRPPMLRVYQMVGSRQTTTFAEDLNDVFTQDEGNDLLIGDGLDAIAVGNSAVGPATSIPQITADGGGAWAAVGAAPFGAGFDIRSVQRFFIDRTTVRTLAVRETDAGNPAEVAYSDDDGEHGLR